MFGALGSISDQNFYMCMQNVPSLENVRAGFLIHAFELMLRHLEVYSHMFVCGSPVSYTHLRAHETLRYLVCRLLLEKKK